MQATDLFQGMGLMNFYSSVNTFPFISNIINKELKIGTNGRAKKLRACKVEIKQQCFISAKTYCLASLEIIRE